MFFPSIFYSLYILPPCFHSFLLLLLPNLRIPFFKCFYIFPPKYITFGMYVLYRQWTFLLYTATTAFFPLLYRWLSTTCAYKRTEALLGSFLIFFSYSILFPYTKVAYIGAIRIYTHYIVLGWKICGGHGTIRERKTDREREREKMYIKKKGERNARRQQRIDKSGVEP